MEWVSQPAAPFNRMVVSATAIERRSSSFGLSAPDDGEGTRNDKKRSDRAPQREADYRGQDLRLPGRAYHPPADREILLHTP